MDLYEDLDRNHSYELSARSDEFDESEVITEFELKFEGRHSDIRNFSLRISYEPDNIDLAPHLFVLFVNAEAKSSVQQDFDVEFVVEDSGDAWSSLLGLSAKGDWNVVFYAPWSREGDYLEDVAIKLYAEKPNRYLDIDIDDVDTIVEWGDSNIDVGYTIENDLDLRLQSLEVRCYLSKTPWLDEAAFELDSSDVFDLAADGEESRDISVDIPDQPPSGFGEQTEFYLLVVGGGVKSASSSDSNLDYYEVSINRPPNVLPVLNVTKPIDDCVVNHPSDLIEIQWTGSDEDDSDPIVDIYYDTDLVSGNGNEVLVASNLTLESGSWKGEFGELVGFGNYNILVSVNDGRDTVFEYAKGGVAFPCVDPDVPSGGKPNSSLLEMPLFFSWDNDWKADGYRLYLGSQTPLDEADLIGEFDTNTWLPDRSFVPGVEYYWKVVAENDCGESESEIWSFQTVGVPLAFSLSNRWSPFVQNPNQAIELSWNSSIGATSYEVYVWRVGDEWRLPVAYSDAASAEVTINEPGVYYWDVKAVSALGERWSRGMGEIVFEAVPDLSIDNDAEGKVEICLNTVEPDFYALERSNDLVEWDLVDGFTFLSLGESKHVGTLDLPKTNSFYRVVRIPGARLLPSRIMDESGGSAVSLLQSAASVSFDFVNGYADGLQHYSIHAYKDLKELPGDVLDVILQIGEISGRGLAVVMLAGLTEDANELIEVQKELWGETYDQYLIGEVSDLLKGFKEDYEAAKELTILLIEFYDSNRGEILSNLERATGKSVTYWEGFVEGYIRGLLVQEIVWRVATRGKRGALLSADSHSLKPLMGRLFAAKNLGKWGMLGFDDGFPSFTAFKRHYGNAGDGMEWHHIVEQGPNAGRFEPERLHNIGNLIKLPAGAGEIHRLVSAHYSGKALHTGGKTVREWLSDQSFEDQFEYGVKVIVDFGGREHLPDYLK